MTPPPTALTPEEQETIKAVEKFARARGNQLGPNPVSSALTKTLAIIRRLDARVLGEERAREEANSAEIAMAKRLDAAIPQMERMTGLQEDRNRWCEEAQRVKHQRDALARAADMMLAEAKNDITGEYSSPAIRALRAALARLDEVERT